MDKLTSSAGSRATQWLKKNSVAIVVVLSLLHIALAYNHTRDSGRSDLLQQPAVRTGHPSAWRRAAIPAERSGLPWRPDRAQRREL